MRTVMRNAARLLAPVLLGVLVTGCVGEDEDTRIRLVNATSDVESLGLYTGSDPRNGGVTSETLSDYASFESGSWDVRLKNDADGTTLATTTMSLEKEKRYTAIAWGNNGAVKMQVLSDDDGDANAGYATVRFFNATTDAGSLDVYLTSTTASLDNATPNASAVTSGTLSSYGELASGTFRLRVTAAGDKSDLRLDVPAIVLGSKQRVSVVLRQGAGGVLVHALSIVQQGGLGVSHNTTARVRLAAGVPGNGVVAASIGDTTLSKSLTSPAVGNYILVPAGDQTLLVTVNGSTATSATTAFAAGGDYTLLAHGTGTATLLGDDNRLPSNTARAKMRLIHGASGHDSLSLSLNAVAVASDIPYGTSSSWASVLPNTDSNALLEVTSPLSNTPLYTTEKTSGTSGLNITAGKVYTVFMLSGNSEPKGILYQDR